MAFPTDPVPVVVEIAPGVDPAANPGTWTWTDITSSVRLADRISIVTGRQNEATQVDPSRCTMTLDNRSGDFTPRNPGGQWYGRLARNTPIRVSIRAAQDTFSRTSSSGWGTADSGQLWSGYGVGGSVLSTDFTIAGGKASQSVPATAGYRTAWLPSLSVRDCRVRLSGVSLPFTDVTGGSVEPGNILLRAQSITQYYMARVEITTAEAVLCKLYNPAGTQLASATVPGLTHSASQTLEVLAEITGNTLSMKVWATSAAEPSGWHVTATDDSLALPGGVGVRTGVAGGNTNTLPVVASYDSITVSVDRFCGFVSSWPPRWDKSGNDATVPIQADGVLGRLGKGSPPARSPLRRTISAAGPVAYWPGEDGESASALASAIPGHPPMAVSGTVAFTPVADYTGTTRTLKFGSSSLVDLSGGGRLSTSVPSSVTTATGTQWTVHVRADVDPAVIAANFVMAEWTTPGGSYLRWQIVALTTGTTQVVAYDSFGSPTTVLAGGSVIGLGTYSVSAIQTGSTITVTYRAENDYLATPTGTLTGIASIGANTTGTTATSQVMVGHIAIWATDDPPPAPGGTTTDEYGETTLDVGLSARYEPAHARLARLCAEDGVTVSIPSVPEYAATRMGWQEPGTPLDLYRQCEDADQGVLYELGFGLGYLPRDGRYSRPTTLTVDFHAGQVADPPEPVDDDQQLVNRVTVRRISGASATAEDAASVAANGPYETSVDVSISAGITVASDDDPLLDHASWRVHVGATDVMRWPRIPLNLARSPELTNQVLSCRVQSRASVANPLPQAAGDDIDVIVEGYAETISQFEWLVDLNCSPALPWDEATADGGQRVAADGSTLAAALTAGGTSLLLASTAANGPWTQDAADMPLDVRVGGERVTASAIAPAVNDTFTRSVSNGWGAPWTVSGPTSQFLTDGTRAIIGLNVTGTVFSGTITDLGVDYDVTAQFVPTAVAAGAQFEQKLRVRYNGTNWYETNVQYQTTGVIDLYLMRVGSNLSALGSVMSYSASTVVAVRLQAIGSTIRHKIWDASQPEPSAWTASVTDTVVPGSASDGIQLAARRISGNTQSGLAVAFDNVTTRIPQLVTVSARAVNGVARAWSAGTEVDVWQPAIAAL